VTVTEARYKGLTDHAPNFMADEIDAMEMPRTTGRNRS
jgi:hypothetical protein